MKRRIKTLLFFLFLSQAAPLVAQDTAVAYAMNSKPLMLKLNVAALADFTPAVQGAFQYRVYKNFYLMHEVGYITQVLSPYWGISSEMQGLRLKNQLRWYIFPGSDGLEVFYAAAEFMYKKTTYFEERFFSMYDGAYFQNMRYERIKEVMAYSMLLGYEPLIESTPIIFDFYAGMGYRHLYIGDDLPDIAGTVRRGWFYRSEGTYHMPGFYVGMRIGYRFGL